MKIKADSEKLKMIGNNIIDASVDFDIKARELANEVDKLKDVWQGTSSERYISLLKDNYLVHLDTLANILKDYGDYLKIVSSTYDALEQGAIDNYNGGHY